MCPRLFFWCTGWLLFAENCLYYVYRCAVLFFLMQCTTGLLDQTSLNTFQFCLLLETLATSNSTADEVFDIFCVFLFCEIVSLIAYFR